ncbi:DUF3592 domain-containing protein [Streptomyces sp. NPDC014733]|uniref:DUF3592 domain-containing protein n=1 Tax=Streptomyces sp. NPDC014733 TaxID=3364885 RepID=UPI003700F40C
MWIALSLMAGLVLVGFLVHETVNQRRLRRDGVHIEGWVVRHDVSSGGRGSGNVSTPVIGFVDAQGRAHEFRAHMSGVRGYPVGGRAPVWYVPGAPKTARIDDSRHRVGNILGPLMGSIVFVGVAFLMIAKG